MKTFISSLKGYLAVLPVVMLTISAMGEEGSPCANNIPGGPSNCDDCQFGEGSNPFRANCGNVGRKIQDLEVWGGVGEHRLKWTRQGFSRANSGTALFGEGHNWRHSYQWEMTYGGWQYRDIYYPNGAVYRIAKKDGVWKSEAACPDRLVQSGTDYTLQTADGTRYRFTTQSSTEFRLDDFMVMTRLVSQ